ncbi:MAG: glycosyltransferase family 39 protein [bacterium]
MLLNTIFHNIKISWIFMNMFMYVVAGMFFYSLSKKIFKHSVVSFLITLFLVTNYAIIIFGLNYLMDMGGWMFYIVSLYVTYKYLDSEEEKWLWISAVLIGIGGLFKEYSFMGYIPLFGSIIFLYWKDYIKILNKVFWTGFIAFGPMVIMNVYSYVAYDYTYLSWFGVQGITYVYKSRIIEYTKALGSLYNFGWFIFLGGLYYFVKELKNIRKNKNVLFVSFVILSALPVVLWGAITQRVLFIGIPATVLISGLYIEKINKKWYIIAPILTLYIICTYFMDSYILGHISLGL